MIFNTYTKNNTDLKQRVWFLSRTRLDQHTIYVLAENTASNFRVNFLNSALKTELGMFLQNFRTHWVKVSHDLETHLANIHRNDLPEISHRSNLVCKHWNVSGVFAELRRATIVSSCLSVCVCLSVCLPVNIHIEHPGSQMTNFLWIRFGYF
jgi:hypothetical protein